MMQRFTLGHVALVALAWPLFTATLACGQQSQPDAQARTLEPSGAAVHPLAEPLRIAREIDAHIKADIKDYTATMHKRERIDGELLDREAMFVKVRHDPMSVYLYFLTPAKEKGKEVLWVKGRNDGKLVGHGTGIQSIMTLNLEPTSLIAMRHQRYPITEIGFANLTTRLIEVAEKDMQHDECEVNIYPNAKVANRPCTNIVVTHPVKRDYFLFNTAKVFIDHELNVPVRYEAWEWPTEPGGQPRLLEEYTYTNIKINQDLSEQDFDENSKDYRFH